MEPKVFTVQLLEEITNDFSEKRKLGRGAYGSVYKGVCKDGEDIAVKMLHDQLELDDKQFQNEFENLMRLKHQNVVRLVGYCYETQHRHTEYKGKLVFAERTYKALCFEYMQNGSLRRHLFDECDGPDWHTRYQIIKGTCEGLKYLHEGLKKPIYHLDLKPDNILLDNNMVPKLADFGLSKLFGEEQTRMTQSSIGTIRYLPPEYIERNVVSIKLDIFSLGVVIIEIMAGPEGYSRCAEMSSEQFVEHVHDNWRKRLQEQLSLESLGTYCQQVKRCIEIALNCVETDRNKRPYMGDIICQLNETETTVQQVSLCSNEAGKLVDEAQLTTTYPKAKNNSNKQGNKLNKTQLTVKRLNKPSTTQPANLAQLPTTYPEAKNDSNKQGNKLNKTQLTEKRLNKPSTSQPANLGEVLYQAENCSSSQSGDEQGRKLPAPAKKGPSLYGSDAVVLYTTRIRYRSTPEIIDNCEKVRAAIESLGVKYTERDIEKEGSYVWSIIKQHTGTTNTSQVPALFIRGEHFGGVAKVLQLQEEGKLAALFEGLPRVDH